MSEDLLAVMAERHSLRVLLQLRGREGMRFGELQKALALNPNQIDRALKRLTDGLWVIAETIPAQTGPVRVRYLLSRRGTALLAAFDGFRRAATRERAVLGDAAIDLLDALAA